MLKTAIKKGELWWGGAIHDGGRMPFDESSSYTIDLATTSRGNQSAPFFLSTAGRYIWSEKPFQISFSNGWIFLEGEDVRLEMAECPTLSAAYAQAGERYFSFGEDLPPPEFFTCPQYNTWAELTYGQNQKSVLEYARSAVENGYKPGILMIDDMWQKDYGEWEFERERFPDPSTMMEELRRLGFHVMLWIVPYLSPDGPSFRQAAEDPSRLIRRKNGDPVILKWWNGYSAVLNMRSDGDQRWLLDCANRLMKTYGIDGFKFDGGNLEDLLPLVDEGLEPAEMSMAYHTFAGDRFAYHEFKDTWKCGGRPYIHRLRDKLHTWEKGGLADLIPDAIALSLTGHRYICPDMVGGGEWQCFREGSALDEELIVRFAQCSALFPMIQFSVAPWRVLNQENQKYVYEAQCLHNSLGREIYMLVQQSTVSHKPILRSLEYSYPNQGYARIKDQFLLGENIMAAPVLEKGAVGRKVVFPPGVWLDSQGGRIVGPDERWVSAPLDYLPWYRKADNRDIILK